MIVAFDFDGTLTVEDSHQRFVGFNYRMINKLRRHAARGDLVVLVTARKGRQRDYELSEEGRDTVGGFPLVHATVDRLHLPLQGVVFTEGRLKGPYLRELEVELLYDDKVEQRESAMIYGVDAQMPDPMPMVRRRRGQNRGGNKN